MRILVAFIAAFAVSMSSGGAFAEIQENRGRAAREGLTKQEQILRELEKLRGSLKEQRGTIDEQRKIIDELRAEIERSQAHASPGSAEQTQLRLEELKEQIDLLAAAQKKRVPSVFNPSIGLVGEPIFSYRSQGSSRTGSDRPGGFDVFPRSMELIAAASVDPFAKAYVVANASVDAVTGEATLGIEEAAVQTESLPWNLTVKAGRFFGEFGRLGYIHDHELPFVNRPLVLDQYIGGESRTDGAQVSWLLPAKRYVNLTIGLGNQFGGDLPPNNIGDFRRLGGLNYFGRLSTSFDLTPDISLEPGVSGLWNPKTIDLGGPIALPDGSTLIQRGRRLAGADFVVSYRPLRNNEFQSVTWGSEILCSANRYDVGSDGPEFSRSVHSWGLYSYLTYKFHRQWSAGLMVERLEDAWDDEARTSAFSSYVTWTPSPWSQLRLQYTHTDRNARTRLRSDSAIYVQWAWIIGSHTHGWQQR